MNLQISALCERKPDVSYKETLMTIGSKASVAPLAETPAIAHASVHRRTRTADMALAAAVIGDSAAILVALMLGFWIRFRSGWITFGSHAELSKVTDYLTLIGVGVTFLLGAFVYLGVYDLQNVLRFRRVALRIFKASTFWLFAYLGISLALKFTPPISRIFVLSSYLLCLITLLSWRWIFHKLLQIEAVARNLRQRVLFVGWHTEADRLVQAIHSDRSHPYDFLGWIGGLKSTTQPVDDIHRVGEYSDVARILDRDQIDIVILADPDMPSNAVVELSNQCEKKFVQFKKIPSYFQILISGLHLETISGVPVLGVSRLPLDGVINRMIKRFIDVIGALVGLFISAPIIAICGVCIYFQSPGPIFFAQERIGRRGDRFRMYKLRSMVLDADKTDHLNQSTLRQDPRVLKCGAFLRKWNLDELPQFWNVLKGDMSLVGPRPERTFHSHRLSNEIPHYNARYTTKPGMTGWAQIHGLRGDTDLEARVAYDLYYLENWSLLLDIQIMIQTFFRRENAY
jgi:exopolysaccharide biosynthesis polyprenyl glycosylphosphotransferase